MLNFLINISQTKSTQMKILDTWYFILDAITSVENECTGL